MDLDTSSYWNTGSQLGCLTVVNKWEQACGIALENPDKSVWVSALDRYRSGETIMTVLFTDISTNWLIGPGDSCGEV